MKVTQYCKLSDSVARQTCEGRAGSELWMTKENSCLFVCFLSPLFNTTQRLQKDHRLIFWNQWCLNVLAKLLLFPALEILKTEKIASFWWCPGEWKWSTVCNSKWDSPPPPPSTGILSLLAYSSGQSMLA